MLTNAELLEDYTDQELIDEVSRRSVGCIVASMAVDDLNIDSWKNSIKGSPIVLGALSAYLKLEITKKLETPGAY